MKSLNTFFIAVVAGLVMCVPQVGHAQHTIQHLREFQNLTAYLNALGQEGGTPFAGNTGSPITVTNIADIFLVSFAWFHDTHTPTSFEVGRVYERIYDGLLNRGTRQYTGSINWAVYSPRNAGWAVPQPGWSGPWVQGTSVTGPIHIPRGPISNAPAGTIPAGAIFALAAELDGEFYGGYDHTNNRLTWGLTEVWTFPGWVIGAAGNPGAGCSPTACRRWDISFANDRLRQLLTLPPPNSVRVTGSHAIYVHPRSTIIVNSLPPLTNASLQVRYLRNFGNNVFNVLPGTTPKLTDGQGRTHFNVNWKPSDRFEVLYDRSWLPIPRQTTAPGCSGALCFVFNPVGRVSLPVNQYAVPLNAYLVRLTDANFFYLTPANLAIAPLGNTVSFTPPRGELYYLEIQTLNGTHFRTCSPVTTTGPTHLPLHHIPALTSPASGTTIPLGSAVPLGWSTFAGQGAGPSNIYILWVRQNNGSWQSFNMGNSTSANLNGAGLGNWQWDIEVRNANHQTIGLSELGTFSVVWPSPSPSPIMGGLFDDEEFWSEESGDIVSSLETEANRSALIIRDMDGNAMSPIQGLERMTAENFQASVAEDGVMEIVPVEGLLPRERKTLLDIEALKNQSLDQDSQDDWLFMTPEGQYLLYLEYLFGGSDSVSP